MSNRPRGNDADSNKRRRGGAQIEPYPLQKKRMSSIKDVPNQVMGEGKEMLAIPNWSDQGVAKIIQHRKKGEHGK